MESDSGPSTIKADARPEFAEKRPETKKNVDKKKQISYAKKIKNQRWERGLITTYDRKEALKCELKATNADVGETCPGLLGSHLMDRLLRRSLIQDTCDMDEKIRTLQHAGETCTEYEIR
mmetsp:Transcript_7678/g.11576  ORF Transcript_7678/g.11576 Transcript_7678/m.11576 type:complete len:120 (-) Transcript_7678:1262-1621(-)